MRRVATAAALAAVALVALVVLVRQSDEGEPSATRAAIRPFCRPANLRLSVEQRPLNSAANVAYLTVRNRSDTACSVGSVLTVRISSGALGPVVVEQWSGDGIERVLSARARIELAPGAHSYATVIVHNACLIVHEPSAVLATRLVVRTSTQTRWPSTRLGVQTCPRGTTLELGSLQPARTSR